MIPSSNKRILFRIVLAQFLCTSLWFAGNAVMEELLTAFQLSPDALGHLTSAVQLGFITGTLVYAFLNLPDRFSPSRVFMLSALGGALANESLIFAQPEITHVLFFRFLTGFFLAGIYPVGMKIAADYFEHGLGKALGFLVGALVVGTAFPHLLRSLSPDYSWQTVLLLTSALALAGGLLIGLRVPDGPYRKASAKLELTALFRVFRNRSFRAAAFGYFGHMWELYAFYAFVPVFLTAYFQEYGQQAASPSLLSFFVIGVGGLGCVLAGFFSLRSGSRKMAAYALTISGLCCLLSPLFFHTPFVLMLFFLLGWGLTVVADSPMFSTLLAHNAASETKGTALTIVNSLGFAITIFSIQLLNYLSGLIDTRLIFLPLALGPILGLIALLKGNNITPCERKGIVPGSDI